MCIDEALSLTCPRGGRGIGTAAQRWACHRLGMCLTLALVVDMEETEFFFAEKHPKNNKGSSDWIFCGWPPGLLVAIMKPVKYW